MSFGELFQELISAGHSREDILHMSFSQVILFWRKIQALKGRRFADLAIVIRAAFGAKEADFRQFLDSLEIDYASS